MVDSSTGDEQVFEGETVGTDPQPDAATSGPLPDQDDDVALAALDGAARRDRWQSRRPPISHLKPGVAVTELDGVVTHLPLFDVGDRIVVDRCTAFLPGTPWLDTMVGRVRSIDDDTGIVTLFDEESDGRNPSVRYVSIRDSLHDFRLAPARGNPFTFTAVKLAAKVAAQAAAPQPTGPKTRGRPKGSTNRPKEVVRAEREAHRAMLAEKRARRGKK